MEAMRAYQTSASAILDTGSFLRRLSAYADATNPQIFGGLGRVVFGRTSDNDETGRNIAYARKFHWSSQGQSLFIGDLVGNCIIFCSKLEICSWLDPRL